jgi:hypothetical protein
MDRTELGGIKQSYELKVKWPQLTSKSGFQGWLVVSYVG